ncbi:hypothetical protein DAPPUDRAFT_239439, partial [Daphnia pulex]
MKLGLFSLGILGSSAFADYNPNLWGTIGAGVTSNTSNVRTYGPDITPGGNFSDTETKKGLTNFSGAALIRLGVGIDVQKIFHAGLFFDLPGNKSKGSDLLYYYIPAAGGNPAVTGTSKVSLKSDFLGYGGGLRLGYKMDKTLLFANFGAISRRYKINWNQEVQNIAEGDWIAEKKNFTAFVPGLGLEYYITPCVALGMQASVEMYASKTIESDARFPRAPGNRSPRASECEHEIVMTIDYEELVQEAMRGVVRRILQEVSKMGLEDPNHFYVT